MKDFELVIWLAFKDCNNTNAHECVWWEVSGEWPRIQRLLQPTSCTSTPKRCLTSLPHVALPIWLCGAVGTCGDSVTS